MGRYTVPASPLPSEWAPFAFLDLVNSAWSDHRHGNTHFDRLPMPDWQHNFLRNWNLRPSTSAGPMPVADMAALREKLRAMSVLAGSGKGLSPDDLNWLREQLGRAPEVATVNVDRSRYSVTLQPLRKDWAWVQARLARSFVDFLALNQPARLKKCQNPSCSWIFYDESRANNRRWCDPRVCGNLVKVREFRRRHRAEAAPRAR